LLFVLLCFARERSNAALQELVSCVDTIGCERLSAIPSQLLALVPIGTGYSIFPYSIEHLRNVIADELASVEDRAIKLHVALPYAELIVDSRGENASSEQWRELAHRLPRMAVESAFNRNYMPVRAKRGFSPEVISFLQAYPKSAIPYILHWGRMEKEVPDAFDALKKALRHTEISQVEGNWYPPRFMDLKPFSFKSAEDLPLLWMLAAAMVGVFAGTEREHYFRPTGGGRYESPRKLLTAYGLKDKELRRIAESPKFERGIRTGALAIYWLIQEPPTATSQKNMTPLDLRRERELYLELVDSWNVGFFTKALIRGLLIHYPETHKPAVEFVAHLMERCLDGGGASEQIKELVMSWRERSSAPVFGRQVLEKWLGYTFQPSAYAS
jgi:hypothetical protein